MDINEFGQHSLVTWTEADLRKERIEMEAQYICLSCGETFFYESEIRLCSDCGKQSCPNCGSEVSTIEEYDINMQINQEKIDNLQ